MTGLLGKLLRVHQVFVQGMEGFQQSGGKAARRAKSRPRRNVRHAGDLQAGGADVRKLQRFSDDRVLNFLHRLDPFHLGVLDDELIDDRLVQGDVNVLIDGASDDEPAVFAVIGRQIGSASAQRNAQGAARDDHGCAISPPGIGSLSRPGLSARHG